MPIKVIEVAPKSSTNINESALHFISSFKGDNQSRLVDYNYTMLSDIPAYEGVYYDYRNNETRKVLNIWAYSGNDSFSLLYHTEPGYFKQYLPDAKKMIDSFEITKNNSNNSKVHKSVNNE